VCTRSNNSIQSLISFKKVRHRIWLVNVNIVKSESKKLWHEMRFVSL